MNIWGPGVRCYSLDIKHQQKTHVLTAWSPTAGTILEVVETLEVGPG
jgi:hypothetical protein